MSTFAHGTIICKEDLLSKILNDDNEVDFEILIPQPVTKEQCIDEFGDKYLADDVRQIESQKPWLNECMWNFNHWGTYYRPTDTSIKKEGEYYFISFQTDTDPDTWVMKLYKTGKTFIYIFDGETGYGWVQGFNGQTDIDYSWSDPEGYDEDGEEIRENPQENEPPSMKKIKAFFGDE